MKIYNKILTIMMALFLISLSIASIITVDKEFSETENRVLKKMAKFSWENLKSGKFTEEYEEYITDQFPFRDFWVSIKSGSQILLQRKDNKGVYLGKDGYLLQKPQALDEKLLTTNINAINSFAKKNPSVQTYFLLAPNSVKVLEDKLPPFATTYDQLRLINNAKDKGIPELNFVDIYEDLSSHKEEYIYYKTDHHWTSLGAYYAYKNLAKLCGFQPLSIENFNVEKVTEEFYGTLYSKGNYTFLNPDSIHIFKPTKELSYKVEYLDDGKISDSLYELKHLEKKDKYSVFLDGNHALVSIKTNAGTGRKLLVIKDSYAHSLVPFLTNHYDEIYLVDLRYFNMSINDYINENNLKEVLILYNVISFAEDSSIVKLDWD